MQFKHVQVSFLWPESRLIERDRDCWFAPARALAAEMLARRETNLFSTYSCIIVLQIVCRLWTPSKFSVWATETCLDTEHCTIGRNAPQIHIHFPEPGSQLQMNESRVRYVVEYAPAGSVSRIFLNDAELEVYRGDTKSSTFPEPIVDLKLALHPADWTIKVGRKFVYSTLCG